MPKDFSYKNNRAQSKSAMPKILSYNKSEDSGQDNSAVQPESKLKREMEKCDWTPLISWWYRGGIHPRARWRHCGGSLEYWVMWLQGFLRLLQRHRKGMANRWVRRQRGGFRTKKSFVTWLRKWSRNPVTETWLRKWSRNPVTEKGATQRALRMTVESGRHREDTTCRTQQLMTGKLKTVEVRVSFVTWLRKRFRNLVTEKGATQRALRLTVESGRHREDTTCRTQQLMTGKLKTVEIDSGGRTATRRHDMLHSATDGCA